MRRPRSLFSRTVWNGLAARVAGRLALALLPIGAIAIYQAWQIGEDVTRRQEAALLTTTAEASAGEALAIAGATGAVAALVAHIAVDGWGNENCSEMFRVVVQETPQFSFAGFADSGGILRCASSDVGRDIRDGVTYAAMQSERRPVVLANQQGQISGTSVIISAAPVYVDNDYAGFVILSVPHSRIRDILNSSGKPDLPFRLLTFNSDGAILSAVQDISLDELLPMNRTLPSLVGSGQMAFSGPNQKGEDRSFAVVPIIPGVIYALGTMEVQQIRWARLSPIVFPALMLTVGLLVAFFAVDRLVIQRIRELRRFMLTFAETRRVQSFRPRRSLPREFVEIGATWRDLAEKLLREEAELENSVYEKNVLLKEVHHRVKNNLQLIASIVNLKIRRATSAEARRSLGEVRMRVQSISSVHQALYSGASNTEVRADQLLQTVVDDVIAAGTSGEFRVDIRTKYAPVLLMPDQAVPFLLLASETVTNALKYIGAAPGGDVRISVTLSETDPETGEAEFRVANTLGDPLYPMEQVKGSGLGRSLVSGFATQIGGRITVEETEQLYDFRMTFKPAPFDMAERDMALREPGERNEEPGKA
ncbi:MAG: sensor histidine kinase [Pseudooceanicola sp.]